MNLTFPTYPDIGMDVVSYETRVAGVTVVQHSFWVYTERANDIQPKWRAGEYATYDLPPDRFGKDTMAWLQAERKRIGLAYYSDDEQLSHVKRRYMDGAAELLVRQALVQGINWFEWKRDGAVYA